MPSKRGLTSSTPAIANPTAMFQGQVDTSSPSTIDESSFVIHTASMDDVLPKNLKSNVRKGTTFDLMCQAIEAVGVPRKGASYISIQKWIISNKEQVEAKRLRPFLKKAITKGLESGLLKRPAASKNSIGLQGYFILNKKLLEEKALTKVKTKKVLKKLSEKTKPPQTESLSDTEMSVKPKNKNIRRLNLSDSVIENGRKKNKTTKATEGDKVKLKPRALKVPKPESGPIPKLKTKAAVTKSKPSKATQPILKPKAVAPKKDIEKVMKPATKVTRKVLEKAEEKPTASLKANVKVARKKKLYTSKINPATHMSRKDLSDTELSVKPNPRKSLKSYSSDTEIEVVKKEAAISKLKKGRPRTVGIKKLPGMSLEANTKTRGEALEGITQNSSGDTTKPVIVKVTKKKGKNV